MELDEYFEEAMTRSDFNGEHKSLLEKWKSDSASVTSSDDNNSGGFDCNICLDAVQDPVVTLCGHLFCWPCIYKWLHFQRVSAENQDLQQSQCPVCKAGVSQANLIPLYGRGRNTKTPLDKVQNLGIGIPRRPAGPICGFDAPRSVTDEQFHHGGYPRHAQSAEPYYHHHHHHHHLGSYTSSSLLHPSSNFSQPVIGMLGEMVYERVFGNPISDVYTYPNSYHLAGTNTPRLRRHILQADKSLSRICFFLFCCAVFCLVLF